MMQVMETNGDSDCEVFEDSKGVEPVGVATSRDKAPPLIRASSSSSSRKSSYCGEGERVVNELKPCFELVVFLRMPGAKRRR